MVLTYGKYIELMSALDEYSEGTHEKHELQSAIFNHYAEKFDSFVAENINGSRRLFKVLYGKSNINKAERKAFRNFMNEVRKSKKKKKLCRK